MTEATKVTKEQVLDVICGALDGSYDDELEVFMGAMRDPAYRGEALLVVSNPDEVTQFGESRFRIKVEEARDD